MSLNQASRERRGFTLIELLVVIAIIALLIGILLPAIGKARDTARAIVCRATMRDLNLANQAYAHEHRDYYSSPVNVGARYHGNMYVQGKGLTQGWKALEGNNSSTTPITNQDWISPILGDSVNLPDNRARRMAQLLNQYGCASSTVYNNRPYRGDGVPGDIDDFDAEMQAPGILQTSYLMPSAFAHMDRRDPSSQPYLESLAGKSTFYTEFKSMFTHGNSPRLPAGFRHRMDRVGTSPSSKVMFADGTRYWDRAADGFVLTINPMPIPGLYGDFTESTPTYKGSTAYGRERQELPDEHTNLRLSFRHANGLNTAYFDGSVRSVTQQEAWTDPNPWHPTGSIWTPGDNTQESIEFMEEQQGNRSEARIH